jgi:hypothetical protein
MAPTSLGFLMNSFFEKNYFNVKSFHQSPYFELKAMEFKSGIVVKSQGINKILKAHLSWFVYKQLV